MARVFENVLVFDGTGSSPFPGEVRIEGNRIAAVAKGSHKISQEGAEVIDGQGATLMPGLCEPHAHITYPDMLKLRELGDTPPEEHVFVTMHNARKMLDAGFTSLYSAASSKPRTEVVVRNEINAGRIPGPRFRAASPEIVSTGGLGDERQLHMYHQGIELIADGADEVRRTVRMCIREGVDQIKINISGDNFVRLGQDGACTYTEEEVKAAADEANERGVWLSCHSRADKSVRMALKFGFRVLYHCEHSTDATLDLIEAAKDRIFLAPAIGANYRLAHHAQEWGITHDVAERMGVFKTIEQTAQTYNKLRKRGVRVLPGGDYGFIWNPIGTNARDLEYFVNLFGYTPAETLSAATMLGGQIMGMPDLGLIKEGFLADLLLVDGDPTADIKILQDQDNLLMIMKDGAYHKAPRPRRKAGKGSARAREMADA
ncbi:metal-dependent hydrolase family protein [Vineibacter terrae]|uniref:metal-dependent hydrolase family protein n=1 Tax=Vineibacter terrae TaxID=2586908 RepID=UPI002E310E3A|nr:amidohydrolase family protein [Vineibacter terrae]HEX2886423.1 amidohydrolase family protein [Vineibacter terrae]